ncbi:MAG TPA: efflux RND transporter permease subunit [Allosphingosinicella sp.]|nr:efflux RND transporter permease subunit [Allosphingosinicella sp.]
MGLRNISAWSIRNPVPPIVLFLALMLAGIVSFMRMEVQGQPDIDIPLVIVNISQPGAAPSELENQVTQKVEAAIRSVNGIDELTSSVSEGSSQTRVALAIGTPIDRAVDDVRDAVQRIRSDLPDGILEPQVMRIDTAENDIASFAAITTDMSIERLSWYVDNTVARELLSVPGLASVARTGGVDREIRVILDPARLQAYGVTAAQVNQQLRSTNINTAGGRAEIGGREQALRVTGNAATAFQLGETQIAVGGGRTVRLSALADVRDAFAEQRSYATRDGQQVLSFSIQRAQGYSDLTVFEGAEEKLRQLNERNAGVKFELLSTNANEVEDSYKQSMTTLFEGALLAVVVVFLFLRAWRATSISAVDIRLSAFPTFFFMDLLGFTLNGMTLLALSLVAGVLVDDAIVEIENIVRHMRMGKNAYQASIEAADEIGLAVVATTFSIVAVFMPVGFMPGVPGQYFKNFGFTVVAAVLISLAVARMITPMMAAYLLKPHGQAPHGEGPVMNGYMAVLRWTLKHRWATVVGGFLSLVATVFMFMSLPSAFFPPEDMDEVTFNVGMAPGTTLEQSAAVVKKAEEIIRQEPEVTSLFSRVRVGGASIQAVLKDDRERTSVEFQRAVTPKLAVIPDARVFVRSQTGAFRDVSINLGGEDPVQLTEVANKLVAEMQGVPEVVAPRIGGSLVRPEIMIKPRLDLAAELGVSTQALSQAIRVATIGEIDQNSARFSLADRQIPIRVALSANAREQLSTIQNLPVPTSNGGSIPLGVIADIKLGAGPTRIERSNQMRVLSVGADLAPGVVDSQAREKIKQLPTMKDLPIGVQEVVQGQQRMQAEMMANFAIAVVAGLLLVLAVLILLYKRALPPLVNMGSLFLAPLGGLVALWLVGYPVTLPVYIGMLMLIGIVAKNSILLIDFALEEMNKGVDKFTAIMDAGHKRAQPIVMTTVAMSAGMVPTALALHGPDEFGQPMGTTVIGGLILSTFLTLVLVPGTFSLALGVEQKMGPRLRRWLTNGGKDAAVPGAAPQPAE